MNTLLTDTPLPLPGNGEALFQIIVNKSCNKLEQKNARLMLIRLNRLDFLLSEVEKRLAQIPA
jgi:hypothetical protein